jgi:hypothetical protein
MGISPFNVIAIGDAENDHAFLQLCGCAIAVANALDAVKETADYVTRGARGEGVQELVGMLAEGSESSLLERSRRHGVVFAKSESSEPMALYPSRGSILIAGQSGSGKSTLSTALVERISEMGFQACILDPEGDYTGLDGIITHGDAKAAPREREILDLLGDPDETVAVNMLGLKVEDRPGFFADFLPDLAKMRAETGRPHWILVDEAHHMFPAERQSVPQTLPKELPSAILVTVHPKSVARDVLDLVDTVIGIGDAAPDIISEACAAMGESCPKLPEGDAEGRQVLLWARGMGEAVRIKVEETRQARRRHTRKYAEGSLGEDKSFYFRGPEGALNLRAQNLMLFVQIGEGVDEATWLHHLHAGDYSQWFRTAIKDEELAAEAEMIEADSSLGAEESRKRIVEAVRERYTAPATPAD